MESKQDLVCKAKTDLSVAMEEICSISREFLPSLLEANKDVPDVAVIALEDAVKTARNLIDIFNTLNDCVSETTSLNIKYEAADDTLEINDSPEIFSFKDCPDNEDANGDDWCANKTDYIVKAEIEIDDELNDANQIDTSDPIKYKKDGVKKRRRRRKKGEDPLPKKKKSYICKFCPQIFNNLTDKGKHMIDAHDFKFDCEICGFKMTSAVAAHRHKKIHHPELYKHHCSICGAGFETEVLCEKHAKTCEGSLRKKGKVCICTVCGKTLSNRTALKLHVALHDPSYGKHKCEECGKLYTTENLLNFHRRTQHEGFKVQNVFPCEICGKILTRASGLRDHIKLVHDKIFDKECPHCEFKASTNVDLKKHIEGNHLGITHSCDQCGMEFKYSNNLSQHKKVHSDVRPFVCQECGSSFKKKSSLDRHILSVHSTSSFPCHECGKMFKSELNMLAHMRMHDEDVQFPCTFCSRKFVTRTKLKMHINTHTGETPYKCPHNCGKAFHSSDQLSHHKKQCRRYELYPRTNSLDHPIRPGATVSANSFK